MCGPSCLLSGIVSYCYSCRGTLDHVCQGALGDAMCYKVASRRPKGRKELSRTTTLERVAVYKFVGEDGTPTKHFSNTDNKVGTAQNSNCSLANARPLSQTIGHFCFLSELDAVTSIVIRSCHGNGTLHCT